MRTALCFWCVIQSFRHKGLRRFFETGSRSGVQAKHAGRLRLQLTALDTAQSINDMDIPGSPHPGEFIRATYIEPFGISIRSLARSLRVSPSTLTRIINQRSGISPEMALRLSKALGRSPESWLAMQDNYNLYQAKKAADLSGVQKVKFDAT